MVHKSQKRRHLRVNSCQRVTCIWSSRRFEKVLPPFQRVCVCSRLWTSTLTFFSVSHSKRTIFVSLRNLCWVSRYYSINCTKAELGLLLTACFEAHNTYLAVDLNPFEFMVEKSHPWKMISRNLEWQNPQFCASEWGCPRKWAFWGQYPCKHGTLHFNRETVSTLNQAGIMPVLLLHVFHATRNENELSSLRPERGASQKILRRVKKEPHFGSVGADETTFNQNVLRKEFRKFCGPIEVSYSVVQLQRLSKVWASETCGLPEWGGGLVKKTGQKSLDLESCFIGLEPSRSHFRGSMFH